MLKFKPTLEQNICLIKVTYVILMKFGPKEKMVGMIGIQIIYAT
jgi:hypothetical protein